MNAPFDIKKINADSVSCSAIKNITYFDGTCGIGMLVSIFITGAIMFLWHIPFVLYIGEGIGLELFGIAWLVKGEAILKDN